jgi:Protein of unknown function (DUF3179)
MLNRRTWIKSAGTVLFLATPLAAQQPPQSTPAVQPNGGPFVELRDPHFVPAAQATFMKDTDRVLGVEQNGIAHAYLTYTVAYHHIIQDRLGDIPILATW